MRIIPYKEDLVIEFMSDINGIVEFYEMIDYNNRNRTQHASQRCGPRWVF